MPYSGRVLIEASAHQNTVRDSLGHARSPGLELIPPRLRSPLLLTVIREAVEIAIVSSNAAICARVSRRPEDLKRETPV